MTFKIDELTLKDSSDAEQSRTRKIFIALKNKAANSERLTEHEKEFLYQGLCLSQLDDGSPDQFQQCDNPKFKWLFLIYYDDLTGGSEYFKPSIGKGKDPSGKIVQVSISESQSDLEYLIKKAEEFDLTVQKNQSDQLLQEIVIEARRSIKDLNNLPEFKNDPFFSEKSHYKYKRWKLLLRAKWIYHIAQEIYETQDKPFLFSINSEIIEINEYSLVHVVYRHFAQLLIEYPTNKSFHIGRFNPRILGKQLEQIFRNISASYTVLNYDEIYFKLGDEIYALWTSKKQKFAKGKVEEYRRLQTLYPVIDSSDLDKIQSNYTPINITTSLSIFEKVEEMYD